MNNLNPLESPELRNEIAQRMNIVRRYTHCILTKTDIGTGVTFRLDDRLFLITAGHVLQKQFDVFLFVGEGAAIQAEVLNYHSHPDSMRTDVYADVGFVEIRNVPHVTACDIEQFHIGLAQPPITQNTLLFIAGCPGTGYDPNARPPEVGTAVIAGYLHSGNERILELEYERDGYAVTPDGSSFKAAEFFKTPGGFSGGGVWTMLRVNDGELFTPQKHIKMSGTQFQWNSGTRLMQAMRPRFGMPLFFEFYPELRAKYGHILAPLTSQ